MPFCTQCGSQVYKTDTYCAACGSVQGEAAKAEESTKTPGADFLANFDDRKASVLCYIPMVGWIASIVVLAAEKYRDSKLARFHAFQGLYLFVLWLFVDWVFGPITFYARPIRWMGGFMKVAVFGAWIFMLVKTSQNQLYRLPVLGELAERSVSEQR